MTTQTESLLTERIGPILRITFNRPTRLNAATREMEQALLEACTLVNETAEIRVVILRGASGNKPAFMAGNDIAEFERLADAADVRYAEESAEQTLTALENLRVPVVTCIDGATVGQGALLAACSDIVVAGPGVRFGFPIARTVGNCLSSLNLLRLSEMLGAPLTRAMIMRATLLDTEDLVKAGAVVATSPTHEGLSDLGLRIAEDMAVLAPLTLSYTKRSMLYRRGAIIDNSQMVVDSYLSRDSREAVSAFLEKRVPRWENR